MKTSPQDARVLARLAPTPAARAAHAGTEKERAYLAAVEDPVRPGDDPDTPPARMRRRWRGCTPATPAIPRRPRSTRSRCSARWRADLRGRRGHARGTQRLAGGQRDADPRGRNSRRGPAGAPRSPRRAPLPAAQLRRPRARAAGSRRRRASTPGSLPSRATRATCRRTSSSSSGMWADAARVGSRRLRRLRRVGQGRRACHRPCAATTRCRGCSTSCSSSGDSAMRRRRSTRLRRSSRRAGDLALLSDLSSMRALLRRRDAALGRAWPTSATSATSTSCAPSASAPRAAATRRSRSWRVRRWRRAPRHRRKATSGPPSRSWSAKWRR